MWESGYISLLSQCHCDFCLWKMTFWKKKKVFHPDGFSLSHKMMENSATTLTHYAVVRSGKENSFRPKFTSLVLEKALKSRDGQCDVSAAQLLNTDSFKTERKRRLKCPSVVFFIHLPTLMSSQLLLHHTLSLTQGFLLFRWSII